MKKKEERKKEEVLITGPPAEKPSSHLELWQSDDGAVELGPGGTSHLSVF